MKVLSWAGITAAVLTLCVDRCRGDSITLTPSQVGQLTQFPNNTPPSGPGNQTGLFAGLSGGVGLRRGLLEFNVAGSIPAGSTIESVTLSMVLLSAGGNSMPPPNPPPPTTVTIDLFDVTTSWTSAATWTSPWSNPGGDFSSTLSGSQSVGQQLTTYSWSSPAMVQDVQNWLNSPSGNFGWIVVGDEIDNMSVRRFSLAAGAQPTLEVVFSPVPAPPSLILLATGMIGMTLGAWRRKRLVGRPQS